jgi:ribonuclease P protein component
LQSKALGQTLAFGRRIRQRTEFEQAFRANRLTNKWFTVYVRKNESGFARLGLVVSKKTIPKAIARNFAKRLVREVFRRDFSAEQALDIVVRARRQINPENSAEGRQALAQLLQAMQA